MSNFFHSILLVDDDEITNFLHTCLLENLSITGEICPVTNGQQALAYLQAHWHSTSMHTETEQHKLILLDVNMPGMDGFEFLEHCQHLQLTDTFTVMLSSSSLQQDKDKAFAHGITAYVEKPLNEEKIRGIIHKIQDL